jgi:hypothetical protein
MSAFDYIGRRFDVLALQDVAAIGEVQLQQRLFDPNSGEVCTGVQKLAQRWVLEFFTVTGSIPFQPRRGVDFLRVARRGGFRSEADVIAEYNFAAVQIKQTLQNEEVAAMQDDERLLTDELLELLLEPGRLSLKVRLTSVAGEGRRIILPISTSPIKTS